VRALRDGPVVVALDSSRPSALYAVLSYLCLVYPEPSGRLLGCLILLCRVPFHGRSVAHGYVPTKGRHRQNPKVEKWNRRWRGENTAGPQSVPD
jgi:hypothetical protein